MDARETRSFASFKKQVGHVRLHGLGKKSRQVDAACRKLEARIPRLEQLASDIKGARDRAPKGETIDKWRNTLRAQLRNLAYHAKAYLHLTLKVPHKEARNALLIATGEDFGQTLRPHLNVLVENGMDDDCLDVLTRATEKLRFWTTTQSEAAKTLAQLHDEEAQEMGRARDLARALHGAVLTLCQDEPMLLGPWNEARRIPKRLGRQRERGGGHLKADARKAKRNRSPTGRPADFREPGDVTGGGQVGQ